ncbi:MAG: hypothetical protein K5761_00085 [Clostridiales bacterium]|nr:hypothetical protein [Clostridiales bacterium]
MAKKKSSTKKPEQKKTMLLGDKLPQNIISIGEHVEENKNIYIRQETYNEIHRFTKNKTVNESGGVLLGEIIEAFGKVNIVISAFIEAKYSEGTPTTLKFTHETWEYIHKEAEKKYPELKIVGWIHTHPDFGIFLSDYDKFIHENFFSEENQIAYVVDPIQKTEGFYFWINGKIERCKGFFVFDKTGTPITVTGNEEKEDKPESSGPSVSAILLIASAVVIILALIITCFSLSSKINKLEERVQGLEMEIRGLYGDYFVLDNNVKSIMNPTEENTETDIQDGNDGVQTESTTQPVIVPEETTAAPETTTAVPETTSTD